MSQLEDAPIRYGDWSKDKQGWMFGLSGGALAVVVLSGVPVLLAIGRQRWLFALGALPVWALVIAAVCLPVRGRSAGRWLVDAALRAVGLLAGWSAWQSRAAAGDMEDPAQADLPGVLAGVRAHDGPPFGALMRRPAIVQNSSERTWAVIARITHPGIGLVEQHTRARMAAGLSRLLEGAATGGLVSVIAVQVRTVPDDGAERAAWQARNLRADAPALALQVTRELSEVMVSAGVRHEVFVTVVVPEQRLSKRAKEAGGGIEGRARVLYGVMSEVEAGLAGAVGCGEVSWLNTPELAAAIRTGFAPGDRAGLVEARLTAVDDPAVQDQVPMAAAGPSSAPAAGARQYTHDAWTSASCTILLPEQGAIMGALAPVFAPSAVGERRSVTLFFEAIEQQRANKLVGRESMSAQTGSDLRRRMGFQTRAAHIRDEQRVASADARLAAGRALVRVAAAAAVTVPSTWSFSTYADELEASIRRAGFVPLRLDLAQDSGFVAACIPLGIGLPHRRRRGKR